MSAKWMRVETDFVDHPKVARLAAALNEPLAGWYVLRTWTFMSRFCPTGHVRDIDGMSLEGACGWRGERGALLAAMVGAGLLDLLPDGSWQAHDWDDHQGKVSARAQKEAERKRAYRERLSRGRPADAERTKSGRPAQRDVTGRDVTGRKRGAPPAQPRDSDLLCDDFRAATGSAYLWQGAKDGAALADLLKASTLDEVRARWRRGLARPPDDWLGIRTVAQLRRKWNDLATDSPKQQRDPNAGLEKPTRYLG